LEALWRGKWLLDLIRRQKGGVMLPLGVLSAVVPLLTPLKCSGVLVAVVKEC
jgi:hypothetical protein